MIRRELKRGDRHGRLQASVSLARNVLVPARPPRGLCRTEVHQRAHGTRGTFGRCDERNLPRGVGCCVDRGETFSAVEGCGVLGCAVWHLRKLGTDHTGGDPRHGSSISYHSSRPQRSALAGECCDSWLHERRDSNSCHFNPNPMGSATTSDNLIVYMLWAG